MDNETRTLAFAARVSAFLTVFDAYFLEDPKESETLLVELQESLEERILRNTSAMAVIHALGGDYDAFEDKEKLKETKALLELLKARDALKRAAMTKVNRKEALANFFGLQKGENW